MKILYVMHNNEVSGGNRIIFEHANRLSDRGHDVSVWFAGAVHSDRWYPQRFNAIETIGELESDYDAVVVTYFETYFAAKMVSKLRISPMVYLVQGREPYFIKDEKWKKKVELTYANPNTHFITISQQLHDWLLAEYKIQSDYVPNGLDMDFFQKVKTDMFPYKQKPVIMIEGSFKFWLKGVADAMCALKELRKEGYDFTILHLSRDDEKLDGVDMCFTKPPQEFIPAIYSYADIVVKPSYMEGSPLPHMEAMACSSLLVTSDCVGTEEYCEDGINCLKFKVGDVSDMKRALRVALSGEFDYIRKDARKFAEEMFEWDEKIDRLEEVLQRIVADKKPKH